MIVPKGDNLATCTTLLIPKKLEYTLVLGSDFQMNHKIDIQATKNGYLIKQPLIKGSINSGNYKLRPVTDQELQEITARKTSNGSKASINEINVQKRIDEAITSKRGIDLFKDDSQEDWKQRLKARINPELKSEENARLYKILLDHHNAFSKHFADLGKVPYKLCSITIDIGDKLVLYNKPYPQSLDKRKRMKTTINKLLQLGIIEESDAEGESPAILVTRPDKNDRLVIDYRSLNRLIKRK